MLTSDVLKVQICNMRRQRRDLLHIVYDAAFYTLNSPNVMLEYLIKVFFTLRMKRV